MKITSFSRKFIKLLSYETPKNSLPFIIFTLVFIYVNANMLITLCVGPASLEEKLLTVIDSLLASIMFGQTIKRTLNNNREMINLLELIESDFAVSQDELIGRDRLWLKIYKYYQKKRRDMLAMYKRITAIFIAMGGLLCNRNVLNYFSGLITIQSRFPTPYLTYCPPEFNSTVFFVYTYLLQGCVMLILISEGFLIMNLVCLSTERVLADFETLFILLEDLANVFPDLEIYYVHSIYNTSQVNQKKNDQTTNTTSLRRDMACITRCHQTLNRDFRICLDGSGRMISQLNFITMLYSCSVAYLLFTTDDLKKKVNFATAFILVSMAIFFAYHNGQRILNQNDILRRTLAELPWMDKPQWFKQTLCMMMTRANVDIEMRPYRIYTLNYTSFKELMKTAFSIGNILYTKKLRSQTQH